jgi:hypothetical protein
VTEKYPAQDHHRWSARETRAAGGLGHVPVARLATTSRRVAPRAGRLHAD